jgi:hypothetical protein
MFIVEGGGAKPILISLVMATKERDVSLPAVAGGDCEATGAALN